MDGGLEYSFGTGDGQLHTWTTPPDLDLDSDGILDAVRLDFDGDGHLDDAMWDSDADGIADTVVLDVDGDQRRYADSGRGLWDVALDADDSPPRPGRQDRPDQPPDHRRESLDLDGDGRPDLQWRRVRIDAGEVDGLYVDTDGDGEFDQILLDTDGDGQADRASQRGSADFHGTR